MLGAIERSELNAVPFVDPERRPSRGGRGGRRRGRSAACPSAVKELDNVAGWPATEASLVFKDRIATYTSTMVQRLVDDGGAVLTGLATASEFGGLNVSTTRLHGTTHNPWQHGRTAGGSSGGSAAAVAGGRLPARHRRRRRRLDPHPRRVQRPRRDEGHRRADPPRPAHDDLAAHGRDRLPQPLRARRRPLLRRLRGLRPPRPVQPPEGGRLGARPRHARPQGQARRHRPDARVARSSATRCRPPCSRAPRALARDAGLEIVDVAGAAARPRPRVGPHQPGHAARPT